MKKNLIYFLVFSFFLTTKGKNRNITPYEKLQSNLEQQSSLDKEHELPCVKDFKAEIIKKFYPRSYALCITFFTFLNARDLAQVINQIVELIEKEPWFYVTDHKKSFYPEHLDKIIEEVAAYFNFLNRYSIDAISGKCSRHHQNSIPIKVYWKMKENSDAYQNIVLLYFTLLVRKMASLSLLWNKSFSNYLEYKKVFEKAAYLVRELDTNNQQVAQECLKTYQRIMQKVETASKGTL